MVLCQYLNGEMIFDNCNIGMPLYGSDKTVLYFGAGIVFVVENAEFRVPSFAVQVELAFFIFIKIHSPVDERFNLCGSFAYDFFYGGAIAYPVTGNHRIFYVFIEIVYQQIGDRGYSSLCKIGVGFFQTAFTDKGYFSFVCHFQGKTHSGNTGTDDEEIELFNHNLNVYYRKTTK